MCVRAPAGPVLVCMSIRPDVCPLSVCRLFLEKIRHHPDFAQAPPPDKARVKKVSHAQ